jgi:uncharacterized protein YndB with AHSA1/START domain
MGMKQIEQIYIINAPLEKVWQALTTAELAEQWGASPAEVDAQEGGAYSYWDGDIHGIFTKLVPYQLIEQDWYGHDNPTWKYTVSFSFDGNASETKVHMVFAGDIQDEQKDIADWKDYYFDPIKKLLEQ